MFACILSASCDWVKEQQHLKIKDQINDQKVTVIRGAFGTAISIPVRDIVVGDIVQICQGDRVPADCIILDEMNLEVDESIYGKDRANVKKEESQYFGNNLQDRDVDDEEIDNHKSNPDFILLSDSKVMKGEGRAIVCAVGKHTYLARKRTKQSLIMEEEKTLLEQKLEQLSEVVSKWINLACFFIIVTLGTHVTLQFVFNSEKTPFSDEFLMSAVRVVVYGLCLLIVAIPEGMPLAVSIAMSMQV